MVLIFTLNIYAATLTLNCSIKVYSNYEVTEIYEIKEEMKKGKAGKNFISKNGRYLFDIYAVKPQVDIDPKDNPYRVIMNVEDFEKEIEHANMGESFSKETKHYFEAFDVDDNGFSGYCLIR